MALLRICQQALAAIMLWAAAAYLLHRGKSIGLPLCLLFSATAVSAVYICFEKTMGFGMSWHELSNIRYRHSADLLRAAVDRRPQGSAY